jgi:hypothetical protein
MLAKMMHPALPKVAESAWSLEAIIMDTRKILIHVIIII